MYPVATRMHTCIYADTVESQHCALAHGEAYSVGNERDVSDELRVCCNLAITALLHSALVISFTLLPYVGLIYCAFFTYRLSIPHILMSVCPFALLLAGDAARSHRHRHGTL